MEVNITKTMTKALNLNSLGVLNQDKNVNKNELYNDSFITPK